MSQPDRTSELEPVSPPSIQQPERSTKAHRLRWVWLLILILLGIGAYSLRQKDSAARPASAVVRQRGPAVVPVVAAKTKRGSIGVFFTGLGAVTPINTVTVKSRVDGQLIQVHY